jgi:hypothetical protein
MHAESSALLGMLYRSLMAAAIDDSTAPFRYQANRTPTERFLQHG